MFDRIKKLLFDKETAATAPVSRATNDRDMVTALLIQTALIDGVFADEERATIVSILMRDHGASEDEAVALITEAEAKAGKSSQMFGLTTAINKHFDLNAKIALMERLWEVTLADRVVNKYENNLMLRIAGLLQVPDHENAGARQRVIDRINQGSV